MTWNGKQNRNTHTYNHTLLLSGGSVCEWVSLCKRAIGSTNHDLVGNKDMICWDNTRAIAQRKNRNTLISMIFAEHLLTLSWLRIQIIRYSFIPTFISFYLFMYLSSCWILFICEFFFSFFELVDLVIYTFCSFLLSVFYSFFASSYRYAFVSIHMSIFIVLFQIVFFLSYDAVIRQSSCI